MALYELANGEVEGDEDEDEEEEEEMKGSETIQTNNRQQTSSDMTTVQKIKVIYLCLYYSKISLIYFIRKSKMRW